MSGDHPTGLTTEYQSGGVAVVDCAHPRFGWLLPATFDHQQEYCIRLRDDVNGELIWDSGQVRSPGHTHIKYDGSSLQSFHRYCWEVQISDGERVTPFSKPHVFFTGILDPADRTANWIDCGEAPPLVRHEFSLSGCPTQAICCVGAIGFFSIEVNGIAISNRLFEPAYTDPRKAESYSLFDIISPLRSGVNAIGVMLGKGYNQVCNADIFSDKGRILGFDERPYSMWCEISILNQDGSRETVRSDSAWRFSGGPIIHDDIFNGENFDSTRVQAGWSSPGFDAGSWTPATVRESPCVDPGDRPLRVTRSPYVQIRDILAPISVSQVSPDQWVADYGANITGYARLRLPPADRVRVRLQFSEVLNSDGSINKQNYRSARAEDDITVDRSVSTEPLSETWEPRFSWRGFRYAQMQGFPGRPDPADLLACNIYSAVDISSQALETTGAFFCSNDQVNAIQEIIVRTQLNNLLSVPTDCPQRDERQGWLADGILTAEEAIFNFDMPSFYSKWLEDIRDTSDADGKMGSLAPNLFDFTGDFVWSAMYPILLWTMYLYFGDIDILADHYCALLRFAAWTTGICDQTGLTDAVGLADHLSVEETEKHLVANALVAETRRIVARVANVLGHGDEENRYSEEFEKTRESFNRRFLRGITYANDTQLSYAMPICFDLVPKGKADRIAERFFGSLNRAGHRPTGGIVGTKYICEALRLCDRADIFMDMLLTREYPSWGYMLGRGATSVWERWDYRDGYSMNSHNHPALGAAGEQFFKMLAGITPDPEYPGFERISFRPSLVPELEKVDCRTATVRGMVGCSWVRSGDDVEIRTVIPPGAGGTLFLPANRLREEPTSIALGPGDHTTMWKR